MIPERLAPETPEWDLFEAEHRQRYEFFASKCRGLRVLDVACGVGYGTRLLAEHGAASVTGVDISPEAIAIARTRFAHQSVEYVQGDATNLAPLGKTFDAAVSFETIEHLADPAALIRAVHRVIAPGGFFACSTPNRNFAHKGGPNPYHLCEWSHAEFLEAFGRHFEIAEQYHQSPSPAYIRHLDLLRELGAIHKQMRFSVAFRFEGVVRRILGKEPLNGHPLPESLWRIAPGDYPIEPLTQPSPNHNVFLLAGRARQPQDV
jgi:SAM-dependent methyltransferase